MFTFLSETVKIKKFYFLGVYMFSPKNVALYTLLAVHEKYGNIFIVSTW